MSWFLGGHLVTKAGWLSPTAVYVDFVSSHQTGWLWQLYANRTLIGRTTSPGVRRCVGQLQDATAPAPLTLVRVDPGSLLTDFGPLLPKRPWNRFALEWDADTDPNIDTTKFEITGATAAGGAVDAANIVATEQFVGVGHYRTVLPALAGSGAWAFQITGRDDALPFGNAGTAVSTTINAVVMPTDVKMDGNGHRFTLSATGGLVTVGFEYG